MLWPRTMRRLWGSDPWDEMRRLQREMNRLFSGVAPGLTPRLFPPVNVWVDRDRAVVTAELPGVDPAEVEINVVGDSLSLSGSRQADELGEGQSFTRQERPVGAFSRTIQLPFRVEPDKVEATYARGILTITLPRLEADRPRQISIQAGQ
ncbi:MAG: Hsp20/alpha crystallin family protein [Planctomycetota bacterium]